MAGVILSDARRIVNQKQDKYVSKLASQMYDNYSGKA
jgi:hypothetical protein